MRERPLPATALSRRSLGLALGGAMLLSGSLTGCDLDDLTGRGPGGPLGTGDDPAEDPDRLLVDEVVLALDAQLASLGSARTLQRLRAPLAPLAQMHRAHRAVLVPGDADVDGSSAGTPITPSPTIAPPGPARASRTLRRDTSTYQQRLVTAALAARSGALATLLASMSASVAQHLAVLPADVGGPA